MKLFRNLITTKFFTKINFYLALLFFTVLFKSVVFTLVIPMWHTPDEQAHFAQVAYFAEFGRMPKTAPDLTREIFESEKLLGTDRDENGNNKFTYHPEYKIEYTDNLDGKYEKQINDFPVKFRKELTKQESANYPPLYYWISAIPYLIFYDSDLITRMYAVRFISILMGLGLVVIAYLIGKEIFESKTLLPWTFSLFIAFHPMLSFVYSGINSDNLFNLLFGLLLLLNIKLIKEGISRKVIFFIITNLLLLYITKPQFILAVPIIIIGLALSFVYRNKIIWRKFASIVLLSGLGILVLLLSLSFMKFVDLIELVYPQSFYPGKINPNIKITIFDFIYQTINKFIHETIPWYWGVFKWLSLVYPIEVIRIINRILILVGLGVLVKIFLLIKNKEKKQGILLGFLIASSLIYLAGIFYYDYLFTLSHGFSFGIQGRYLFPTIISQMAVILVGFTALVPEKYRWKQMWTKLLGLGMILLNFIALVTIANSYYDLSSLDNFVIQVSQYKPWFFKGWWVIFWILGYLTFLAIFIYKYFRLLEVNAIPERSGGQRFRKTEQTGRSTVF